MAGHMVWMENSLCTPLLSFPVDGKYRTLAIFVHQKINLSLPLLSVPVDGK